MDLADKIRAYCSGNINKNSSGVGLCSGAFLLYRKVFVLRSKFAFGKLGAARSSAAAFFKIWRAKTEKYDLIRLTRTYTSHHVLILIGMIEEKNVERSNAMKGSSRKRTDVNVEIGGRLKRMRKSKKISVNEMADSFGIVRDSYTRIENGTTGLSGEYSYILATKYHFDMNYLFGGVVSDELCYEIETQIKEKDSMRLAELLRDIADIIESKTD